MKRKPALTTKYDAQAVEADKYQFWLDRKYFQANPLSEKPKFSIIMPPPNVTGKLHLGHAWDGSLQDALIRFKKLTGHETIYLPGMDHAGIATQTKVEAELKAEGINRFDLGRSAFLKKTWA